MNNRINGVAKALYFFTEVSLTAIIPIIIWIALAGYVQNKLKCGNYVTVIGIILGVITAYMNLYKLFKKISADSSRKNDREKKE